MVVTLTQRQSQRGLTLVELLLAMTVAALILGAMDSVVMLALRAQQSGRQTNELVYQSRFALDRMAATARATAPKALTAPLPGTSGDWFSPTMYCLKGGNRLVETVVSDTSCTGAKVIAYSVVQFSAQLPSSAGPVDRPVATLSLTLSSSDGDTITLTSSVRLGGGEL
jgi:prepilin-type N-terminal cleavage/methylation domain-containing protein